MNGRRDIVEVRFPRRDLNSRNQSNQYVTVATVSREVGDLFDEFRKKRITLTEARQELDRLSVNYVTKVPFAVYVNVHNNHASVVFFRADFLNQTNADIQQSRQLARISIGLHVFFSPDSFLVINPVRKHRIDLYTTDGQEYKIGMTDDVLRPGAYEMFKCYEVIGVSTYDIEWAYLMAAQDWHDVADNNCLSYSKRIIREIHRQVMGVDLDTRAMNKLNKLYKSMSVQSIMGSLSYPISSFSAPRWLVLNIVVVFLITMFCVEIRLRYFF